MKHVPGCWQLGCLAPRNTLPMERNTGIVSRRIHLLGLLLYEPQRKKNFILILSASRDDSDQPAHWHSRIRIFLGRILDSKGYNNFLCGQRRL